MKKRLYEVPTCTVIHLATEHYLLEGSGPKVQPGGGNNGHVTIENPGEDNEDTEISGAKRWGGGWEEED